MTNNAANYMPAQYNILSGAASGAINSISPTSNTGYVLTSNGGSSQPSFQAVAGSGDWVLLQTQNASSSASIAFNSTYITSTYVSYVFAFSNLLCSSSSVFSAVVSVNNGSSYASTGYLSGVFSLPYNSSTITNANSTSAWQLYTGNTSYTAGGVIFMTCLFELPINITGTFSSAGSWYNCFGNYVNNVITNVKFSFASGNITSGNISLYGLVQ